MQTHCSSGSFQTGIKVEILSTCCFSCSMETLPGNNQNQDRTQNKVTDVGVQAAEAKELSCLSLKHLSTYLKDLHLINDFDPSFA